VIDGIFAMFKGIHVKIMIIHTFQVKHHVKLRRKGTSGPEEMQTRNEKKNNFFGKERKSKMSTSHQ
jgi:hypothetical protein